MLIESALDYIRLLKTVSIHNNLGASVINKLYDSKLIICSTRRFWDENERGINGEYVIVELPTYKYSYFNKDNGKPIKYGEITARELKQAVKNGVIEKRANIKGCKKMQIYSIDSTYGKAFNTGDYEIDIIKIMKKLDKTDVEYIIRDLVSKQKLDAETSIYLGEAINYIFGVGDLGSIPNEKQVDSLVNSLIDVLNKIDADVGRPKLIDIKREALEELTDTIICSIDAKKVREMMGGVT